MDVILGQVCREWGVAVWLLVVALTWATYASILTNLAE